MSQSISVTFRIPSDLTDVFLSSVAESGTDKTSWLIDAIKQKIDLPESNHNARLLSLVERMEKAASSLAGGRQDIPPNQYNEAEVIRIVASTIRQGFNNGRVISERLNEAGYQTKAGKSWNKDIYSAWKRQDGNSSRIAEALSA